MGGGRAVYTITSYLDANELFAVADASGATAVHPGYGFFRRGLPVCPAGSGAVTGPLEFIGPSWWVIRDLGDKINTKRIARSLGVPTVPGSDRPVYSELEADEIASSLFEFQATQGISDGVIMVKASAGGGGMGIEEVGGFEEFRSVFRRIRNYAKRNFGDEGVLIEQRIFDFNHLEVQVLGERGGRKHVSFRHTQLLGAVHGQTETYRGGARVRSRRGPPILLMPRACSTRSPAIPWLWPASPGTTNVGTWEWIITPRGGSRSSWRSTRAFRLKTGVSAVISRVGGEPVDIITEQIRLALGDSLDYGQSAIGFEGVGIEYRLVAENTDNRFTPCAGTINRFDWQEHDWLDVYTQVPTDASYEIPMEFDPNLALAIVWGNDLAQAKERGLQFLDELILEGGVAGSSGGFHTNVAFSEGQDRQAVGVLRWMSRRELRPSGTG